VDDYESFVFTLLPVQSLSSTLHIRVWVPYVE